jgi:fatty acid CoA ligase FadD9
VTDAATGRRTLQLLEHSETITYRDLWVDVRALAGTWQHDAAIGIQPGDLVCILGFAGAGYVIADLAATHCGAVSVPLQTNAAIPRP